MASTGEDGFEGSEAMVVFRRKSCVIAIPIDAKAMEVRSQARNVRSMEGGRGVSGQFCLRGEGEGDKGLVRGKGGEDGC